jgi:twitching motility protein PilT
MTFDAVLESAARRHASDIHLRAGQALLLRVQGTLERVPRETSAAPSAADLDALVSRLLSPDQRERWTRTLELDAALTLPHVGRCRASIFRQRGTTALVLRVIPAEIPALDTLGLPASVAALADLSRGLVLVTGATGSGKSTTLAALVDRINQTRPVHILTIEDPVEFLHRDARALVSQREVGLDVPTYAAGLKSALRQDPDVILLGELRDRDTIETALIAAETGHLVLSTLHTLDAPETVNRIVSVFEPHHQPQIRVQLARVLRATVTQRLLPRADGHGRVLAAELLVTTPYIRDCITDRDKTALLPAAIVAGASEYGMQSFDQSILQLCQTGRVTVDEALRWVTNVDEFQMRLRGITPGSAASSGGAGPTAATATPTPAATKSSPGITRFGS